MFYAMTVAGIFLGALSANMLIRGHRRAGIGWAFTAAGLCAFDSVRYGLSSLALTSVLALLGAIVVGVLTYAVREWGNLG